MNKIEKAVNFFKNDIFTYKNMKYLFIFILSIFGILSFTMLLRIHWEIFFIKNLDLNLTFIGLDKYLSYYYKYSQIFTATISMFSIYMIVHDLEKKKKQEHFEEVLRKLNILGKNIKNDELLVEQLTLRTNHISQIIYNFNSKILNKDQLEKILIDIFNNKEEFKSMVNYFEEMNKKFQSMGGCYENDKTSYSLPSFNFIFINLFDSTYDDIIYDLQEIYITHLNENRKIDPDAYRKENIKSLFQKD